MTAFLRSIWKSIVGPDYYTSLSDKRIWFSFKYYSYLSLTIGIVIAIWSIFTYAIPIHQWLTTNSSQLVANYPSDLQVTIVNGTATTTVTQPYYIKLPASWKPITTNPNIQTTPSIPPTVQNLLVIDTVTPFSVDEFQSYNTAVLLTENTVVYYRNGQLTIQPLTSFPNFTFNKDTVTAAVNKAEKYYVLAYPGTAVVAFIIFIFYMLFQLLFLLFGALIVWVIAAAKKIKISYAKAYQLGIHLMTGPIIVSVLFLILRLPSIPFLFTLLFALFALANVTNPAKASAVSSPR